MRHRPASRFTASTTRRRRDLFRPRLETLEDRLTPAAGALDPTFGVGGSVLLDLLGPENNGAQDLVAVQADGKFLVVGDLTGGRVMVLRYNNDGSLDSTFGSGGQALFEFGDSSSA